MNLPKHFVDTVNRIWGAQGAAWLKELPELIEFFSAKWQLSNIAPFDNLTFNYVAQAHSAHYNKPVVLKIGVPHPEFINESNALTFYDGHGSVKLLAHDEQKYGMLLAQIQPGNTLKSFFPTQEKQAIEYACQIMKKLHARPISGSSEFPTIDNKFLAFDSPKIPRRLQRHVDRAQNFVNELSASAPQKYLLHGDLHHDNILLDAQGNAVSIDPKGVVGEAAYEVGAFMCNPEALCQQYNIPKLLNLRLDQFSQTLAIDRERLAKACYARIILSACWTVEAKGDWRDDAYFADCMI
ncbi:aminoglycoside O-phosphotransferase APH(6)-Id [soil metagenome]